MINDEEATWVGYFARYAKQNGGKIVWQVCRSDKSDSTPEKKLFHNINMLGVTAPTLEMPGTCFQSYVL